MRCTYCGIACLLYCTHVLRKITAIQALRATYTAAGFHAYTNGIRIDQCNIVCVAALLFKCTFSVRVRVSRVRQQKSCFCSGILIQFRFLTVADLVILFPFLSGPSRKRINRDTKEFSYKDETFHEIKRFS